VSEAKGPGAVVSFDDVTFHSEELQAVFNDVKSYLKKHSAELDKISSDIKAFEGLLKELHIIDAPSVDIGADLHLGWSPKTTRVVVFGEKFKARPAVECKVGIRRVAHKGMAKLLVLCKRYI